MKGLSYELLFIGKVQGLVAFGVAVQDLRSWFVETKLLSI